MTSREVLLAFRASARRRAILPPLSSSTFTPNVAVMRFTPNPVRNLDSVA